MIQFSHSLVYPSRLIPSFQQFIKRNRVKRILISGYKVSVILKDSSIIKLR